MWGIESHMQSFLEENNKTIKNLYSAQIIFANPQGNAYFGKWFDALCTEEANWDNMFGENFILSEMYFICEF